MGRRKESFHFEPVRKRRGCGCLLWLILLAMVSVGAVIAINDIYNRQVKLVRQSVSVLGLSRDLEGFSILHISDLNGAELGEEQAMIGAAIDKLSYNAVCITGDMVGNDGNYKPFIDLLALLDPAKPILFIPGDCDPPPLYTAAHDTLSILAPYITAAQSRGAVYLDAPYALAVGKTTVWFSPEGLFSVNAEATVDSYTSQLEKLKAGDAASTADGAAEIRAMEYLLEAAKRLAEARLRMKSADIHIALTHAPLTYDYVRSVWDWESPQGGASLKNVTLALAGHYNGGQWRVPGLGALYVPGLGFFPEDRLVMGLNRASNITQYISPGLGSSQNYPLQPGRLFNAPTVTLITLTGKPQ